MHDLNAIAIFVQVVQSGSFSSAAKRLSIPLSTVSRKVAELENHLNVKLLERSTRSCRLTEVGASYFEHCVKGLETLNEAHQRLEDKHCKITGTLRISLPPNLAEGLFLPIISRFQNNHPDAHISVWVSERLVDLVADQIDLAFRVGHLPNSNLKSNHLLSYRHRLVTSPHYIKHQGKPNDLNDLHQHPLLAFNRWQDNLKSWELHHNGQKKTFTFKPRFSINDYKTLLEAAINGAGIAEIPEILCRDALDNNLLVELLPDWQFPAIELRAVHSGTKNMPAITEHFLSDCVDYFKTPHANAHPPTLS